AGVSLAALRRFGKLRFSAGEEVEDRHANGDAVRDLVEDHAEGTIGHIGVDFDAAVHRAGMKDENVTVGAVEPPARHTKDTVVFAQRWDVAGVHALEL